MNPILYAYLSTKLREPSTYAGFVTILAFALHRSIPPEFAVWFENTAGFVAGALLIWANERRRIPQGTVPVVSDAVQNPLPGTVVVDTTLADQPVVPAASGTSNQPKGTP